MLPGASERGGGVGGSLLHSAFSQADKISTLILPISSEHLMGAQPSNLKNTFKCFFGIVVVSPYSNDI